MRMARHFAGCWLLSCAAEPAPAQSMIVTATAYNSVRVQTDSTPHIGACNEPVERGAKLLAVSRDLMKAGLTCGSRVKVEGIGEFRVWDKMNRKWTRRIDIHMGKRVDQAVAWGEKKLRIWW